MKTETKIHNCPQCGYSAPPRHVQAERKHLDSSRYECKRCNYSTATWYCEEHARLEWNTVHELIRGPRSAAESHATTLDFWLEMRKGISYGMTETETVYTAADLDLATDNAVRTVLRDVFGWEVARTDAHLKSLRESMDEPTPTKGGGDE